jgi:hypothetical protein
MANDLQLADATVNAAVNAITALLNGGFLDIYDSTGTGQPANANTAITTQVNLANLTFGSPAFGNAMAGVATANAIGTDTDINATGTATWARLYKSDHTTVVCDMSISTSGADINFDSVAFQIHAQASLSALTLTLPEH